MAGLSSRKSRALGPDPHKSSYYSQEADSAVLGVLRECYRKSSIERDTPFNLLKGWQQFFDGATYTILGDQCLDRRIEDFHKLVGTMLDLGIWDDLPSDTQVSLSAYHERDHARLEFLETYSVAQLKEWITLGEFADTRDVLGPHGAPSEYIRSRRFLDGLCPQACGASRHAVSISDADSHMAYLAQDPPRVAKRLQDAQLCHQEVVSTYLCGDNRL